MSEARPDSLRNRLQTQKTVEQKSRKSVTFLLVPKDPKTGRATLGGGGEGAEVDMPLKIGVDSQGLSGGGGVSAEEAAVLYGLPTDNPYNVPMEGLMGNRNYNAPYWQDLRTMHDKFSPIAKKAGSSMGGSNGIKVLTMMIGPQEYRQDEPNRSTVTQTIGGAFIDDFGLGLKEISIDFVSGFRKRIIPPTDNLSQTRDKFGRFNAQGEGAVTDGFQNFKAFRDEIYRQYFNRKAGSSSGNEPEYEMRLMVWENNDYYAVHPMEYSFSQSVTNPLLYRFSAKFLVVRDLTEKEAVATAMQVDADPLAGALTDPVKRSILFEAEAIRQMVNLMWEKVTLNNPPVDVAKSRAKTEWESSAKFSDIPFEDVKPYFVVKAQEYRLWKSANKTPLKANYGSKVGWARISKTPYKPLTPLELNEMKGAKIETRLGGLLDKVNGIREGARNFNTGLATNFNTTTSDLRNTLLEIQKVEDGLLQLPRELLPFPLVGAIRDMTCLVRSVMSFPELMKDSTNKAIADFRAAIKNSGCANTILPR